ncbi:MAG: hypothetical protein RL404_58 [Pseudomonadota bacterium]
MTGGQDAHLVCHDDLEHVDHLECLEGQIGGKVFKMIKVLNIRNMRRLSIMDASMRSARNFSSTRLARASADVM